MFSVMIFKDIGQIVNLSRKSIATLALLAAMATPAAAAIGDWAGEGSARVRLVAAGVDAQGRLAAGIEIDLDPGGKT
jgi:DsbC/DsbD-like thiol-disulfide interchange protein